MLGGATDGGTPSAPVAYVMSRFPKLSETFILAEMLELERGGTPVEVFPLRLERPDVVHDDVAKLGAVAHDPLRPRQLLAAQAHWLLRAPRRYLAGWWEAIRGNARSPRFLARALAVVPVAAWMAREMQQLGVRHVHAHYATHPALAAYVVHRLTGLPYSVTAHAHDLYVNRSMLARKLGEAQLVVTISDFNRRLIADECGPVVAARVAVVRCGVDPELFPLAPPREPAPGAPLHIVCIASLEPYKGHPYLLEALALLRDADVACSCTLVGEGEDRAALELRAAELGLEEIVAFAGGQPRRRVSELVAEADVVVLPSVVTAEGKMEGIPVALMEGMAAGKPVVATRISGIPELVEDGVTGLLAPPRDASALAAAVRRLHDDPQLARRLAAAGRERVLRDYDLRRNVHALSELLKPAVPPAPAADPAPAARHRSSLPQRVAGAPGLAPWIARSTWSGLLVLNYHRIARDGQAPAGNPLWSATAEQLDAQLAHLTRHVDVIDPHDLLEPGRRPRRAVMLTFDDGYRDNHDLALPLLSSHGVPAAFFVATGFVDAPHVAWWDEIEWMIAHAQRSALPAGRWAPRALPLDTAGREQALSLLTTAYKALRPRETEPFLDALAEATGAGRAPAELARQLWMTWDMVRALRDAGMRVGGHTVSHPVLSTLDADAQQDEIDGCARRLAQELDAPMRLFAYPVGLRESFDERSRAAVEAAGVSVAFSYYGGHQRWRSLDPLDVRRASVGIAMTPERFRAMMAMPQMFARW